MEEMEYEVLSANENTGMCKVKVKGVILPMYFSPNKDNYNHLIQKKLTELQSEYKYPFN